MPEFAFTELLSLGPDTTQYRLLTTDGVSRIDTSAGTFLRVEPEALTLITETAMRDIAHQLRPRCKHQEQFGFRKQFQFRVQQNLPNHFTRWRAAGFARGNHFKTMFDQTITQCIECRGFARTLAAFQ